MGKNLPIDAESLSLGGFLGLQNLPREDIRSKNMSFNKGLVDHLPLFHTYDLNILPLVCIMSIYKDLHYGIYNSSFCML